MKITIKATQLELTPALKVYIETKLGVIARLVKKVDKQGVAEARVEVGRTTKHHKHGEVFAAEVNLRLPGATLRATQEDVDMRVAIDKAQRKLRLEVDKYKAKHTAPKRATRPSKK